MYLTGREFCRDVNDTKINNITNSSIGIPLNFKLDDLTIFKFNITNEQADIDAWCP